jgi:SOS response regulatory protein OraA/RecX
LLTVELRHKGVTQEIAEQATAEISDEEAAFDAASRRLGSLRGLEYGRFRERLGAFLTRRGFSYDVARRTIERCWADTEEQAGVTE